MSALQKLTTLLLPTARGLDRVGLCPHQQTPRRYTYCSSRPRDESKDLVDEDMSCAIIIAVLAKRLNILESGGLVHVLCRSDIVRYLQEGKDCGVLKSAGFEVILVVGTDLVDFS